MITKEEITSYLSFLNDESQKIIVVYGIKEDYSIFKLNIQRDHLDVLLEMIIESVIEKMVTKNYLIKSYRTADERKAYYEYDFLEETEEIRLLRESPGNDEIPNFNFNDNSIADINSLIIVITNGDKTISLYKDISGVEKIYSQRSYIIKKSVEQFVREDEDMLRISSSFHMIRINGVTILTELDYLERRNGFKNIIINEAARDVQRICDKQIIDNFDVFKKVIESDMALSKKFIKALSESPVMNIENNKIIQFAKNHRRLNRNLDFSDDGSMIRLRDKNQVKWFLKLINDDFLLSQLSDKEYESGNKDIIKE